MNKTAKLFITVGILLIAALLFFAAGIGIARTREGNNIGNGGEKMEKSFYEITKIEADLEVSNVTLFPCQGETVTLEYYDYDGDKCITEEQNGILRIRRQHQWFRLNWQFLFGWGKNYDLRIGIPENYTGELSITTTTGKIAASDLSLPRGAVLTVTTGGIELRNITVGNDLSVTMTTGSIDARALKCEGDLFITSTTGRITLTEASARRYQLQTTTGAVDVALEAVQESARIETTTGRIQCRIHDSEQNFTITGHTTTGHKEIPSGGNGPKQLQVTATTGSIRVEFTKK